LVVVGGGGGRAGNSSDVIVGDVGSRSAITYGSTCIHAGVVAGSAAGLKWVLFSNGSPCPWP